MKLAFRIKSEELTELAFKMDAEIKERDK